jgi:hypothetical protein
MKAWQLLRANLIHGDQKAIAVALNMQATHVNLWLQPPLPEGMGKPSPVDRYVRLVETVRLTGNVEGADRIHLAVNEALGFAAYKITEGYSDDADFAEILREFSDVVDERARAESPDSPGGRIRTPEERREIAAKVTDLIAGAIKYREDQLALADAEERTSIRRRA